MMRFFNYLSPRVNKQGLFIFAAILWLFAGSMLINKGFTYLPEDIGMKALKITLAFIAGLLFYLFMFSRIAARYIAHIDSLSDTKHPFYKAFKPKAYIMIALMISLGVSLRVSGLAPIEYLALFYFTMGTPLLISSVRFALSATKPRNETSAPLN